MGSSLLAWQKTQITVPLCAYCTSHWHPTHFIASNEPNIAKQTSAIRLLPDDNNPEIPREKRFRRSVEPKIGNVNSGRHKIHSICVRFFRMEICFHNHAFAGRSCCRTVGSSTVHSKKWTMLLFHRIVLCTFRLSGRCTDRIRCSCIVRSHTISASTFLLVPHPSSISHHHNSPALRSSYLCSALFCPPTRSQSSVLLLAHIARWTFISL